MKVALAARGNDRAGGVGDPPVVGRVAALPAEVEAPVEGLDQVGVERVHPRVVELGGAGAENRQLLGGGVEEPMVALVLLADVAQRVLRAAAGEFVDRHEVGEVEHVDFFELGGRTEFAGHNIHGYIYQIDDF